MSICGLFRTNKKRSDMELKPFEDDTRNMLWNMIKAKNSPWLSLKEVALLSGYSISTLRRRIREGRLEYAQPCKGGKLVFNREMVNRFLGFSTEDKR